MEETQASAVLPDWRDQRLGARVRVALWLHALGPATVFTKERLLADFAGVEHVERRMRDLRSAGWIIATYRTSAELRPNEFRLDAVGEPIWEPGKRGAGLRATRPRIRRQVLERDGYRCVSCGISAGERYDDQPAARSRLVVSTTDASPPGTADADALVTTCTRCAGTGLPARPQPEEVKSRIAALPQAEQTRLLAWMARDRRMLGPVELAWIAYRRLPAHEQRLLRDRLAETLGEPER